MAHLRLSLENYGTVSLPAIVRETLDSAVDFLFVTFDFNESGFCWLVLGRVAFVWNFNSIKTLPLPNTALKHHVGLTIVYYEHHVEKKNVVYPSCINVSPEGSIRYWSKVDQAQNFSDFSVELNGQMCQSLSKLGSENVFLLSTSTCSLFLIYPPQSQTKSFNIVPLKPPVGLVSGIGRRFSSFLFASSTQENNLIGVRVLSDRLFTGCLALVLTSKCLQCYNITPSNSEFKILWECDVFKLAEETCLKEVWNVNSLEAISQNRNNVKVSVLDFIVYDLRLFLLFTVSNSAVSSDVHFVVASFKQLEVLPNRFDRFAVLNHKTSDSSQTSFYCKLRFLHGTTSFFLIGDSKVLLCDEDDDECKSLELTTEKIIGSGSLVTNVLIFTSKSGLKRVNVGEKQPNVFAEESSTLHQLSQIDENMDELTNSTDRYKRFTAAFISYLKQQFSESEILLSELFGVEATNDLDELVVRMSQDIIDDYPASDVRWAKSIPDGCTVGLSGNSLLPLYQLEDKRKTLNFYWNFLKRSKLWQRLSFYESDDGKGANSHVVLLEHAEKLDACIAIIEHGWEKFSSLMKSTLKSVMIKRREVSTSDSLTPQDIVLRRVSKCEQLILVLIDEECSEIVGLESLERFAFISHVNSFILAFLIAAQKLRSNYVSGLIINEEYIPWTLTDSMKFQLTNQHKLTSTYINDGGDAKLVGLMSSQLKELSSCMLTDCELRLASLKHVHSKSYEDKLGDYQSFKTKLIEPLIFLNQYEKAAELGERFKDFEILVRICEISKDPQLFDAYKIKFAEDGFAEFVYKYHLNRGKFSRLFEQSYSQIKDFLANRPDLEWIFNTKNNNFNKASNCLFKLASNELDSLKRKKTILSLAKLNALCIAEDPASLKSLKLIDEALDIIAFQERASLNALKRFELDPETMPPLTVKDLIEVYVSDKESDEWGFAKALDLLVSCLDDKETDFEEVKTHVWSCAILKDDWLSIVASDDPMKNVKFTLFNKIVTLILNIYKDSIENLRKILPSASALLSCKELCKLAENDGFCYLVCAGEEELKNILEKLTPIDVNIE